MDDEQWMREASYKILKIGVGRQLLLGCLVLSAWATISLVANVLQHLHLEDLHGREQLADALRDVRPPDTRLEDLHGREQFGDALVDARPPDNDRANDWRIILVLRVTTDFVRVKPVVDSILFGQSRPPDIMYVSRESMACLEEGWPSYLNEYNETSKISIFDLCALDGVPQMPEPIREGGATTIVIFGDDSFLYGTALLEKHLEAQYRAVGSPLAFGMDSLELRNISAGEAVVLRLSGTISIPAYAVPQHVFGIKRAHKACIGASNFWISIQLFESGVDMCGLPGCHPTVAGMLPRVEDVCVNRTLFRRDDPLSLWKRCQKAEEKKRRIREKQLSPSELGGKMKAGAVLKFHAPYKVVYNCTEAGPEGIGTFKPCVGLDPLPEQLQSSSVPYCAIQKTGYHIHYMYFAHAMLLSPWLRKLTGITMRPTPNASEADIILCAQSGAPRLILEAQRHHNRKQLVIIIEHRDTGTVITPAKYILDHRTLGVLKHYAWRGYGGPCKNDVQRHCVVKSRASMPLCSEAEQLTCENSNMLHCNESCRPLTDSKISELLDLGGCPRSTDALRRKMFVALPFYVTVRRAKWINHDLHQFRKPQERDFDLAWTGTFYELDTCSGRGEAIMKLKDLARKRNWKIGLLDRRIDFFRFKNLLLNTKIFLGPWGHGEWSTKDEYAVLSGAVVVKPVAAFLESALPIYKPGLTCIDVRPDWSDLETVVAPYLANATLLEGLQRRAFQAVMRFRSYRQATKDPSILAKFASMLSGAPKRLRAPWPQGVSPETRRELQALEAAIPRRREEMATGRGPLSSSAT